MPKKPSPKNDRGAMTDVASPGKSTPNTGNRPIIVTRKPMVQDPMVKEAKEVKENQVPSTEKPILGPPEVGPQTKKLANSKAKRVKLAPMSDEAAASPPASGAVITPDAPVAESPAKAKDVAIAEAEKAVEEATEEAAAPEATTLPPATDDSDTDEKKDTSSDKKATTKTQPDQNADSDGGLVDELAKQAASKKQQQEEDKVASAQREKLEELIAAKTYNVPTSQVTKRRVKYGFIIVLLVLIIGVVCFNFMLDAGLVDISISPVTDIIAD